MKASATSRKDDDDDDDDIVDRSKGADNYDSSDNDSDVERVEIPGDAPSDDESYKSRSP
jgi:hypothetical protein